MATPEQILRRGRWSLVLGTLIAALALVAVAYADDASNNLDSSVDATLESLSLTVGGADGSVRFHLAPVNTDAKSGCNLTGSGSQLVVGIASSNTSVATLSASSVTIAGCDPTLSAPVAIHPVGAGTASVTLSFISVITSSPATSGADYNLLPGSFTVNVTAVNSPPTANAGGPYSVDESASIVLNGTGSDPDSDPLTFAWDLDNDGSFEAPGQNVTFSAAGRDGPDTQTVRLQVCDNESACATSTATVTINNAAPTIDSVTNSGPVDEGSPATITVSASDTAGGLDPVSYAFDCDNDGVYEIGPQAANMAQCTYPDGPSSHLVNARVTDGDGGADTDSTTVAVTNVEPTIAISGASSVNEGSPYGLTLGAVTDPGTDTVSSYVVHWGDGSSDTYGTNGAKTHTYADGPNNYAITVDLTDEDGTFLDQANALSVTVDNVKPSVAIDSLTGASSVACIGGNSVTLGFSWTDPAGTNDTYAYDVNWGDGSPHATGSNATSPVTGLTHSYAAGGPYTVTVTVNDEDPGPAGSASSSAFSFFYNTSGILQPINLTTPRSSFRIGSTIPVKIRVTDCSGASVGGLTLRVKLQKLDSSATPVNETVEVSVPDAGDTMRYDSNGLQYIYNLSTKRSYFFGGGDLTAGTYRVTVYDSVIAPKSADFDTK